MGKTIHTDIQVRFDDTDMLGHINNVNLQHYFDLGKMDFYRRAMGKVIEPDSESLILVSASTNYFAQSYLEDSLRVETAVEKIGTKSVGFYQRLINRATGAVNADCRTVAVAFDFTSQQSFPLKREWVEIFQEYLVGAKI